MLKPMLFNSMHYAIVIKLGDTASTAGALLLPKLFVPLCPSCLPPVYYCALQWIWAVRFIPPSLQIHITRHLFDTKLC